MKLRPYWEAIMLLMIDWFSGREARLKRVFNEMNVLFQEVHPTRPKPKQDDIIDVLLAIK